LNLSQIEHELKNSVETLLKPILHAADTKNTKLFASSLSIVKKLVTYNLIKQNHTGTVIQILKDILDNTTEEFMQIKVLETLLPMVNPQTIHLTETLVNNVLMMCLKIFACKNPAFRNPVSALFKQLMITTFGFLDNFLRPVIEKRIKQVEDEKKFGKKPADIIRDIVEQVKGTEYNTPKESFRAEENEDLNEDQQENQEEFISNKDNLNKAENVDSYKYEEKEVEENKIYQEQEEKTHIQNIENIIDTNNQIHVDNSIENNEIDVNYKVKPSDIDLTEFTSFEIYQTSLSVFKNLILICDGKKKEWVVPTIYSKCLGIELLAGIICQTGNLFKYLPEFLEGITNDLHKLLKKNFDTTNDYIMGNKLARISIQIVENLNVCYDLISPLLKYAEYQSLTWQKLLGLECLASLFQNNLVLRDLYDKKTSPLESERIGLYDDLLNTLTKVSYSAVTTKVTETTKKKDEKKVDSVNVKHQKLIDTSAILNETEATPPTFNSSHLFKLLLECYINFKDSSIFILEFHNLKLDHVNINFSKEQLVIREMLNYNYESIKNSLTALLVNSHDDNSTQNYLNLFQSFINIYGSISLPAARDSYLNDLCKLAIPNNLENSFEMKDKNLLIAKSLFNIAHCVNILDSNSWYLLIETMQKIYLMLINSNNYMLKPNEEFEIDVVIKNLESNMKKYNAIDYVTDSEEKSVLKSIAEEKKLLNEESKEEILNTEEDTTGNIKEASQLSKVNEKERAEDHTKRKGLFSFMKSALGFSKRSDKPDPAIANYSSTNNKKNSVVVIEENIDLMILATATDTIFINSKNYDERTIKDIIKAILESSKSLMEATNEKSSSTSSDHINTYLHFNLIKILEISVINVKRIESFWDVIVNIIQLISSKSLSNISRFSLDVLTIIDLFILTHYKPLQQENSTEWDKEKWQNTIISPFVKIAACFYSTAINSNIIYNLSKILQNCGQNLNTSGWNSYIQVCKTLILKSDEILCDNTFKLIEQIVNEYLDYLTPLNVPHLLDILESFALYKKNHNISYSAITMFWNAANIVEKFQKISAKLNSDHGGNFAKDLKGLTDHQKEFYIGATSDNILQEDFFKILWRDLFFIIVNISTDPRFDVRKCAINIFADIYVAKVSMIPNEISFIIINKYFLEILTKNYFIFEEKIKMNRTKKTTSEPGAPANKTKTAKISDSDIGEIKIGDYKVDQMKIPDKKSKYEEDIMKKVVQLTSDEKEFEETTILIILAVGKIIRSFLNLNYNTIKDYEYYKENFIQNLVTKYSSIMRTVTPDLASAVLKSIQEIYYSNVDLYFNSFELIWNVYQEMGNSITSDFYLTQLCGLSSSSKMIYNVLEIFKEVFLKENNHNNNSNLIKQKNLSNVLSYLNNLIISSKNSEGQQITSNPQRLLTDERLIFEFIEKFSKILTDYSSWNIYCKFLSSYINFNLNDLHSEAHLRKSLELFETFFANSTSIDVRFVKEYLPKLIYEIREISCLRNKNEYVSVLIKNNKSQMHLWHFAAFQLIKILNSVLCGGNKKDENITGNPSIYNNNFNLNENNSKSDDSKKGMKENEEDTSIISLNEIWEASINCFETIFKQSEGGYKVISRNLLEELLKSCQDMEIQIINFIVNGLLPNSLRIPKEMQIKLLILLDVGSNFDYNTFNLSSQSGSQTSSISRVCISNLFELCKFRSVESLRKGIFIIKPTDN